MKNIYLPEEMMSPRILLARKYNSRQENAKRTSPRTAQYYETGIYTEGGGSITVNDICHPIIKGDVRFIRPGDIICSQPPFSCYTVNFNLGENNTVYRNSVLDSIPSYFHPGDNLFFLYEDIINSYINENPVGKIMQNSLLLELIAVLFRSVHVPENCSAAVAVCLKYINENFSRNITLENLSKKAGYSALHLCRLFKQQTGQTPHEYLTGIRIAYAKRMLINTDIPIQLLSESCGFSSESHFKVLFREMVGISPGRYRKNSNTTL